MTDFSANNRRIAKNTLLLYFRMFFIMAVSLYTSRVVLNTLGIEDFGIYNVVGGVVTMFSFINYAMASGTQRYLTFELGKGNFSQLRKIFNTSIYIHALIAGIIIILAETVGLWFLCNKMTIPADRMTAALWVYQLSILSSVVMIMSVPYNAIIIAHEKMSAFAYISVLEVILKLAVVYLLKIGGFDKLKLYAILIFIVQLFIRFVYSSYCSRYFHETKLLRIWESALFKEMLSFAGWNLWGNCAAVASTQGINILLNIFFGPVVNAARGIAVQVQVAVNQFSSNFQTALNPQITKSYAMGDYDYMHDLIFRSSKFTFFLLLILSLPIFIETETILKYWLNNVPQYTVTFIRLMLCITIIDSVANSLIISAQATGKVKLYQSVIGGILLCILPISYFVLKLGGNPTSVFIVHLCICCISFVVRLFIIRPLIKLSLISYLQQVISKCVGVSIGAILIPMLAYSLVPHSFFSFFLICAICVFCTSISIYFIGLNNSERSFILNRFLTITSKFRK